MAMTKEQRAAYQREYRARRQTPRNAGEALIAEMKEHIQMLGRENALLDEEIVRLKRELAKRPAQMARQAEAISAGFNSRPFTPAPKKGK